MPAGGAPAVPRPPALPPMPLPAPARLVAPAHWRAIDFLSDLHLSEQMPATFAAFETHLRRTPADAVFILGDLFELWVGDDARDEPFARRCVDAMRAAAGRLQLAVMGGNRDFLMGAELLADCGASALPDPTLLEAFGRRVLLSHGDALCLADTAYQQFRRQVRDPAWLAAFLARPLADRLALAREIRRASDTRRQFDGDGSADVDTEAASTLLRDAGATVLVHGHTHRPGSDRWPGGLGRHVLTDWDLEPGPTPMPMPAPTGEARAPRAGVLRLDASGFTRLPPARD